MKKYAFYLGGIILLEGMAYTLILTRTIQADPMLTMGLFWLWTGITMILDMVPGKDNGRFDCYEKDAYGLAFALMGVLWSVISFTPMVDEWIPCLLTLVPPAIVALVGRRWYVERMRSRDWKRENKIHIEKD